LIDKKIRKMYLLKKKKLWKVYLLRRRRQIEKNCWLKEKKNLNVIILELCVIILKKQASVLKKNELDLKGNYD